MHRHSGIQHLDALQPVFVKANNADILEDPSLDQASSNTKYAALVPEWRRINMDVHLSSPCGRASRSCLRGQLFKCLAQAAHALEEEGIGWVVAIALHRQFHQTPKLSFRQP